MLTQHIQNRISIWDHYKTVLMKHFTLFVLYLWNLVWIFGWRRTFQDGVSLCSSDYTGIFSVDQAGFRLNRSACLCLLSTLTTTTRLKSHVDLTFREHFNSVYPHFEICMCCDLVRTLRLWELSLGGFWKGKSYFSVLFSWYQREASSGSRHFGSTTPVQM